MSPSTTHTTDYRSPAVRQLRADLALALRAAAHHGLGEGVCNHFSVALPDGSDRFLLNPRGLHWSEVQADDIVLVDAARHACWPGAHAIEPTAMFIHAAVHRIAGKACVLHTHMPYATALTLTADRGARHHAVAERDALPWPHRDRCATTTAWRWTWREGERIARAMSGADVAFLGNHGVVVCGERVDHAYDDLYYLERACMHQVLAQSDRPAAGAGGAGAGGAGRRAVLGERLQSELFFEALRRTL